MQDFSLQRSVFQNVGSGWYSDHRTSTSESESTRCCLSSSLPPHVAFEDDQMDCCIGVAFWATVTDHFEFSTMYTHTQFNYARFILLQQQQGAY